MKLCTSLFLLLAVWLLVPNDPVMAQITEGHVETVWSVVSIRDDDYKAVFSPQAAPEIVVLAGQMSLFDIRQTWVYFWPIDQKFRPDWTSVNEVLAGQMEVQAENGRVVLKLDRTQYLINLQAEAGEHLILGAAAQRLYTDYLDRKNIYFEQVQAYDEALAEYLDLMKADPSRTDLVEPVKPEPFKEIMDQPQEAFPLQLTAGSYQIQLLDEQGNPVPGSQRTVKSIAPRSTSIGYTILPERKWTVPTGSEGRAQLIYASAESQALFIQPHRSEEYNQRDYARLIEPQEKDTYRNRWIWVPGQATPIDFYLQVFVGGDWSEPISIGEYVVEQSPGSALGYSIRPAQPDERRSADIVAYRVQLPANGSDLQMRLVDVSGQVIPGSLRRIVRIPSGLPHALYLFLALPLVAWGSLRLQKRKTLSTSRAQILSQHEAN